MTQPMCTHGQGLTGSGLQAGRAAGYTLVVKGPSLQSRPRCTYQGCGRPVLKGGRCNAHQPLYVASCRRGEHDQCYEDGLPCCTCGARKGRSA